MTEHDKNDVLIDCIASKPASVKLQYTGIVSLLKNREKIGRFNRKIVVIIGGSADLIGRSVSSSEDRPIQSEDRCQHRSIGRKFVHTLLRGEDDNLSYPLSILYSISSF